MAPEVWEQREVFDARKADAWSLGVVLFMMMAGAPCYARPDVQSDVHFQYLISGKMQRMLALWKREQYGSAMMLDLLQRIFVLDPSERYTVQQIRDHPWLR